jgi:hypothetical protein
VGGVRRWIKGIKGWGVVVHMAVWILVILKHLAVRRQPCVGLESGARFLGGGLA